MESRVIRNPEILGGKPIIQGTRISVEMILEWLGSGASSEEIVARYPQLSTDDIRTATEYATSAFRNDVVLTTQASQ